jgi:hypothetical protein
MKINKLGMHPAPDFHSYGKYTENLLADAGERARILP